ncbi:aminodeoxychorismate synthase component I [Methylophilus sp. 5]|uniref:aminodeoxychorismate synthase component I n=1 Tax=Methylophilus sp. 5 TaxID=1112274 RepID=UPI0004917288|nr:aminodeoxychorismate synthase component I [Methylophilus sp. 5]
MALTQFDLPYAEGMHWLQQVKHLAWPMLLESGRVQTPHTQAKNGVDEETSLGARFDIVVAAPVAKIIHRQPITEVHANQVVKQTEQDPFQVIQQWLSPHVVERVTDIPFAGGALGYFAYDLGRSIEILPALAAADMPLPDMLVGIYDWAIIVDHHLGNSKLVSHCRFIDQQALTTLHQQLLQVPIERQITYQTPAFKVTGEIEPNMDQAAYAQAFQQVKDYISAGDCYQINLAQRFAVSVAGDASQAYDHFRQLSRAPFMAYLQVEDNAGAPLTVLSMSPERFLQVIDRKVETRPIKGTRPRHADATADAQAAEELVHSIKDRAENLMIVDLLRNDIGKVCEVGSVKVDALFKLQRFTNVHHLVSIVRGLLAPKFHALDLLRGCFPGGSITGAPKLRAMEIIEALEPHRRGIYCGSIGYIGFDGSMDTNIAIRTAVICNDRMTFFAGGGVVADSDCAKEYQETFDKASQFFKLVAHFKTKN